MAGVYGYVSRKLRWIEFELNYALNYEKVTVRNATRSLSGIVYAGLLAVIRLWPYNSRHNEAQTVLSEKYELEISKLLTIVQ